MAGLGGPLRASVVSSYPRIAGIAGKKSGMTHVSSTSFSPRLHAANILIHAALMSYLETFSRVPYGCQVALAPARSCHNP